MEHNDSSKFSDLLHDWLEAGTLLDTISSEDFDVLAIRYERLRRRTQVALGIVKPIDFASGIKAEGAKILEEALAAAREDLAQEAANEAEANRLQSQAVADHEQAVAEAEREAAQESVDD